MNKLKIKNIVQTETNFNSFIHHLKIICKNRDKKELEKVLDNNFKYSTWDEKEKYSMQETIDKFEFNIILKIINKGGVQSQYLGKNMYKGSSPTIKKMGKYEYIIRFINDSQSKGWKIITIGEGVLPDEGTKH